MAIQDEGQGRIYQDFADNFQLEPEGEEPSAEEIEEHGIRMWQEELPDAGVEGSPESMAMWMIRRLTRRIVLSCVERRPAMCRYMAMRKTMRDVVRACGRSAYNRSRAMVMMHEVTDLFSMKAVFRMHQILSNICSMVLQMDLTSMTPFCWTLMIRRAHGPLDERGLVERSSTIPPYVTINVQFYYTADRGDLPDEAELEWHEAEWNYFHVARLGYHYRVRGWETNEEFRRNVD